MNSASLLPTSLPGGKLAPGARILVPGIRFVDPGSRTTVRFGQGTWSVSTNPITVNDMNLEVVVPPETPAGEVGISVVNGQGSSRPEKVDVTASSPAIVTLNGQGWGPVLAGPVRKHQMLTIPLNGANRIPPKVFVGGVAAHGVKLRGEQLSFVVPSGAPEGCWTPLWLESPGGEVSNFATISIHKRDGTCDQPRGWFAPPLLAGKRHAAVVLERISGAMEVIPGKSQEFSFDSGAAFFFRSSPQVSPVQILPPASTCTTYTGTLTVDLMQLFNPRNFVGSLNALLDAGKELSVESGENHKGELPAATPGFHAALLGGTLPIVWGPGTPLFFDPGAYKIQSDGSASVAKLDMTVKVPPPFEWLNRSSVKEVDRSAGLDMEWSGLGRDRQMVIFAVSLDQTTSALGTCLCVAPRQATHMKIPPYALANFPATQRGGGIPLRFLILLALPTSAGTQPTPDGLDDARAIFLEIQGKNVLFR